MKNKLFIRVSIIAITIISISAIIIAIIFSYNNNPIDIDGIVGIEDDLELVTQIIPTKFVVYGNTLDFHEDVYVKYVDSIDTESFDLESEYMQEMIIINDLDDSLCISDDEWQLIFKLLENNTNYSFFYLGRKEYERMEDLGLIKKDGIGLSENELSVGMVRENGKMIWIYGTYDVNAQRLNANISERILMSFGYSIRQGLK